LCLTFILTLISYPHLAWCTGLTSLKNGLLACSSCRYEVVCGLQCNLPMHPPRATSPCKLLIRRCGATACALLIEGVAGCPRQHREQQRRVLLAGVHWKHIGWQEHAWQHPQKQQQQRTRCEPPQRRPFATRDSFECRCARWASEPGSAVQLNVSCGFPNDVGCVAKRGLEDVGL
jgi:hypothetical protein